MISCVENEIVVEKRRGVIAAEHRKIHMVLWTVRMRTIRIQYNRQYKLENAENAHTIERERAN